MRRAQRLKNDDQEGSYYLTPSGLERLKEELVRLQREQPQAVEDVQRTRELGDLSENAEYQEAKFRLRRINGRILSIKERLKRVELIESGPNSSGRIRLGSTVLLEVGGEKKTYQIVGPRESNPARGRISHLSPLGAALLDHAAGEKVKVMTQRGEAIYEIVEVN